MTVLLVPITTLITLGSKPVPLGSDAPSGMVTIDTFGNLSTGWLVLARGNIIAKVIIKPIPTARPMAIESIGGSCTINKKHWFY